MSTNGLFGILFDVLGGSQHYMVTGSLSFLPLTGWHREPGEDLDVLIRRDVFEARRSLFDRVGQVRVLRAPEVAIAGTTKLSKLLSPRTGFVKIETGEGTLDVVQYEEGDASLRLILGLGIRFAMDRAISTGRRQLECESIRYNAAPPEFMFLTKAVGYSLAGEGGMAGEYEQTKHYDDLVRMAPIIDQSFAAHLLRSMRVGWRQREFPEPLQQRFNPFAIIDLEQVKADLQRP